MSYIPNCREDENYNQKYLNKKDKEFLLGFDWCTQSAVDNFFDNNFEFDNGGYLEHMLLQEVPESMKEKYSMEHTFNGDAPDTEEKRVVKTYADYIRFKMLEWIEMERNELITSMIENMDEQEYEKAVRQSKKEN